MNLMSSRREEPEPEPEYDYDDEDPESDMVAPAEYSDAVEYFNSLPESVRKMILNTDD